ncbi:MAG: hypothetical protein KatS3mg003_1503 [Candidatus Nitrosocaldaceae archaeon]|nr:MAG: hypothetical protein KatS3mg003_1503 [Candidatus Nitrosocaldaceae archaeon]
MYKYISPFILLMLIPLAYGEGSITYIDNPLVPENYKSIHDSNAPSIQTFTFMLEEVLEIPDDIYIGVIFDECGEINAFYSSRDKTIIICYELLDFIDEYAINNYDNIEDVADASFAITSSIFFHEAAHMLIDVYDLPVLGKEEDAADSLSTLMLITLTEDSNLEHIPLYIPLFYEYMSSLGNVPFWDVHALDQQRMYNALCLIYGSNTSKYSFIVDDNILPVSRAEGCEEEFIQTRDSWGKLLDVNVDNSIMESSNINLDTDPLPFDRESNDSITLKFIPSFVAEGRDNIINDLEYEVIILRDGEEVFSNRFVDRDGMLELIIYNGDELTITKGNEFATYTGPYTIRGNIFDENGSYQINAKIVSIEGQDIEPITDEFSIQVVPEFSLAMAIIPFSIATLMLLVFAYKRDII